jgi:hypothetical protein
MASADFVGADGDCQGRLQRRRGHTWAYGKEGHGLPTVLLGSAMLYSSMPLRAATPSRVAVHKIGGMQPSSTPLDTSCLTPMRVILQVKVTVAT